MMGTLNGNQTEVYVDDIIMSKSEHVMHEVFEDWEKETRHVGLILSRITKYGNIKVWKLKS